MSKALAFRLLGHVLLCGVLHVTFQTPEPRIKGQYMICVLYKSCLVLATSSRFQSTYTVVASIGLANSSIEEPGNGRGEILDLSYYFIRTKIHRRAVLYCASYLETSIREWP
jgi:hypothetical protein